MSLMPDVSPAITPANAADDPRVVAAISAAVFAWLRTQGLNPEDWRLADVRVAADREADDV